MMFLISLLKDSVRVIPQEFRKDLKEALINELNRKYSNKVSGKIFSN